MDDHPAGAPWPAANIAPAPRERDRPTVCADRVGERIVSRLSDSHRKEHSLFLTPVAVADFMAGRIEADGRKLRILDPRPGPASPPTT